MPHRMDVSFSVCGCVALRGTCITEDETAMTDWLGFVCMNTNTYQRNAYGEVKEYIMQGYVCVCVSTRNNANTNPGD